MEQELNKLHKIISVSPSDDLGERIWGTIVQRQMETISWYKVAIAACFLGGLLFSGIYVTKSSKSSKDDQLVNVYQLSNSYDLYHE